MAEVRDQPMKKKIIGLCLLTFLFTAFASASTLSVSEVNYIDTDSEFFDSEHVLLQFNADGTDETISATIPASELSDAADVSTDKHVEISAEVLDVAADYTVEDRELRQIRGFEYIREYKPGSEEDAINWAKTNCVDLDGSGQANYNIYKQGLINPWGDWIINCARQDFETNTYTPGYLQSPPDSIFRTEWTVDIEGESPETITISNNGVGSGSQERISDDIQIEFVSLRDLGSDAPNPQNTFAAFSSNEGWKLTEQSEYRDYIEYREEVAPQRLEEMGEMMDSEIEEWDEQDTAKQFYNDATSAYTQSSIYGAEAVEGETLFSDGVMRYEPSSNFNWFTSEFNVRIDGELVGLTRSFAEPTILSVQDTEVNGVSGGNTEVEIRNDGEGTGVFELSAQCERFNDPGITDRVSLDPGESTSVFVSLSSQGEEEFTDSCTITAEDRETTAETSASFSATYIPDQECNPGAQSVTTEDGVEKILECNENGTGLIEVEVCEKDERASASGNGYECQEVDTGAGDGTGGDDCQVQLLPDVLNNRMEADYTITDPVCAFNNWWSGIPQGIGLAVLILDLAVAGAAGLAGWMLGNGVVARALEVNDKTDNQVLKNLIATVLAFAFAIFAYSLFSSWIVKLILIVVVVAGGYILWPFLKVYAGSKAVTGG